MLRDPRRVVAIAYDQLCTFEFGVVVEAFGLPRPEFDEWYRFRVAAVDSGPMRATGGVTVNADGGLRLLDHAGTIAIPGWRDLTERPPEPLLRKLRRAHADGARILSVCSGAFVLAAAGLLDGLRATTHWCYAERLATDYPAIEVDPNVLYIDTGQVLTSAGSAAGLDLCLHLIRRDFGTRIANEVARRLVVPPHREGGQQQFIERPSREDDHGPFDRLQAAIERDIAGEHDVDSMARSVHMSPRTFARRFAAATGMPPIRWLTTRRVRRAQELLETTEQHLEHIATACGFSDAQLLRLHFKRLVGCPPTDYRRQFRATIGSAPGPRRGQRLGGTPT